MSKMKTIIKPLSTLDPSGGRSESFLRFNIKTPLYLKALTQVHRLCMASCCASDHGRYTF